MARTNMRTLHLFYPSWFGYELNITDSDEETLLYFADCRLKQPERRITRHFDQHSTQKEEKIPAKPVEIVVGSVATR